MLPPEGFQLFQSSVIDEAAFKALRKELAVAGKLRFAIASASMEPCLAPGTAVEIAPVMETPRRFDLVVYWDGRHLVCHVFWHERVLGWNERPHFVARGLAKGLKEDFPRPKDHILGKVVSHRLSLRQKWSLLARAFRNRA